MEIITPKFVLPKGQADKLFFELTEVERREIGLAVFQEVTRLAATVGDSPVTTETLRNKIQRKTRVVH